MSSFLKTSCKVQLLESQINAKLEQMKSALLLIFLGLFRQTCFTQETLGLNELLELLDVNHNKLENHLQKKGFKRTYTFSDDESGIGYIRTIRLKDSLLTQSFKVSKNEAGFSLYYETFFQKEFQNLKEEMIHDGYSYAPIKAKASNNNLVFQKNNISIETNITKRDNDTIYTVSAIKIDLPRPKDIRYAEDLLTHTSHECLDAVFGKENVKKDIFYYSDTETNTCSVIFPNTNHEAIFIWNDEVNYRNIAFIIFGGHLKTRENTENVNQIRHNAWLSKQGVYCGMSLREVQILNRVRFSFYNWKTESAGYVVPTNKGNLDFERLGMAFNCLNCNYMENKEPDVIQSNEAIEENQKVFVSSMVVLPEKKRTNNTYLSIK